MYQNKLMSPLQLRGVNQIPTGEGGGPTAADFEDEPLADALQRNAVQTPVSASTFGNDTQIAQANGGGVWDTVTEWARPMLGGALSGMASGGAAGSIVPGFGTMVGMVAGGVAGLGGGFLGHLADKKYEEANGETLSSKMAPEGFNNATGGALPMLLGALAGPAAIGAMALMGYGKSGENGGGGGGGDSSSTATTTTANASSGGGGTSSQAPTQSPQKEWFVGPDAKPRGGDMWTQNALPKMGGLPTNGGPSAPMPDIPQGMMNGLDNVNTAAGMIPNLPGGNALSVVNNAAHIYNEGLTQTNVIGSASTALNFVPQLAPFNAARGVWDGVATFSGHEGLTSTALADSFVTHAANGAASMPIEMQLASNFG